MAKVLVIDDSRFSRKRVVEAVQGAGHSVTEATNGQEGLEQIARGSFDCVVTDNLMPVMEGTEMIRQLRESGNSIPVVMCSADIQHSTRMECEKLGILGFSSKPFQASDLANLVNKACQQDQETLSCK